MSEPTKTEEQQALEAVEKFAYHRYDHINIANVYFSDDEMSRLKTSFGGDLTFTIEAVEVNEKKEEDGKTIWYVSATVAFEVNDGGEELLADTDIYRCCRKEDGTWHVEWHAS